MIYPEFTGRQSGGNSRFVRWKTNVSEKLKTLDDIYRFSVEHLSMVRGELMEATIVAILVFELVLFFMGIMD